jgi:hypothetical protein
MLSLRELQLRLGASLLDPAGTYADPWILDRGIDPATRIGFYRNNVLSNFREALRATYPVIEQLVGAAYFERLAAEFFRAHPSTSGDLNLYGAEFAGFLLGHEVARQLPYLPDVARLEWAVEEAFYAQERAPLDLSRLATVPPDRQDAITLTLHPSCRLLASAFPVRHIWEVHQAGFCGDQRVDLAEGGAFILVRREGFEVALETLTAGSYCLLDRLMRGASLGDALTHAVALDPEFASAPFLELHARAGTFVDFDWPA